jgi:hypothetical protein
LAFREQLARFDIASDLILPRPSSCCRGQFNISEIKFLRKALFYVAKETYVPDLQDKVFVYKAPPSKE